MTRCPICNHELPSITDDLGTVYFQCDNVSCPSAVELDQFDEMEAA